MASVHHFVLPSKLHITKSEREETRRGKDYILPVLKSQQYISCIAAAFSNTGVKRML